jgi:hypothetical protein
MVATITKKTVLRRYLLTAILLAAACDRGPRTAPPAQSIVVASPPDLQALNPLVNTDAATEQSKPAPN